MPTVTRDGVELYYEVAGQSGGPTVAMIQGLGYGPWMWRWQRDGLADDYELVLPDNRGNGRSETPEGPYTIEEMAADLEAVLADHGADEVHLVGASMGGMIAMQYALEYDRAESLTLLCTTPGGEEAVDTPEEITERIVAVPEDMDERETIRYKMEPAVSDGCSEERPDLVDRIVDWRLEQDAGDEARAAQTAAVLEFDVADRLDELTQPALVLHGSDDRVVPVANADLLEALPNGRVERIDGGSHLFFVEDHETVTERIREFLREQAGQRSESAEPAGGEPR